MARNPARMLTLIPNVGSPICGVLKSTGSGQAKTARREQHEVGQMAGMVLGMRFRQKPPELLSGGMTPHSREKLLLL